MMPLPYMCSYIPFLPLVVRDSFLGLLRCQPNPFFAQGVLALQVSCYLQVLARHFCLHPCSACCLSEIHARYCHSIKAWVIGHLCYPAFPRDNKGLFTPLLFIQEVGAQKFMHQTATQSRQQGCCLRLPQRCSSYTAVVVACGHELVTCQRFYARQDSKICTEELHISYPEETSDLQHSDWADLVFIFF